MGALRAGIAGGSLAGLTAALTLRDAGWEVEIFERAPFGMQGTGAGLTVQEPTVRYLLERGGAELDEITFEVPLVRYLNVDGSVGHEMHRPARFTTWGTVHRALLQQFGTERYHAACPVLRVGRIGDRPSLVTVEGERGPYDVIIGADGVGSAVRATVAPGSELQPAGYLSWRGVAYASRLAHSTLALLAGALTYCVGTRTHCVVYPVPPHEPGGETRINLAWYRNYDSPEHLRRLLTDRLGVYRPLSVPPGLMTHECVTEMRNAAHEFAPQIQEIVAAVDKPFVQLIGDLQVSRMVYGRVVLIGDAACVARPHVAAGAAKACENAWTLAAALEGWDGDPSRLESWEQDQLGAAAILAQSGRTQGQRSQVENTWLAGDPTFFLRPFDERVHS